MIELLLIILVLLIAGMTIIEIIAVNFRLIGAFNSLPMIGTHLSMIILLGSRICVALILVSVGYLSDVGVNPKKLSIVYFSAAILVVFILFLIKKIPLLLLSQYNLGMRIFHPSRPLEYRQIANEIKISNSNHIFGLIIIGFISYFGFLVPSLLATSFPNHRGVLLQTGFVFNVIATMLNTFIIEKKIADVCEGSDKTKIPHLLLSYNKSKAMGIIISAVLFLNFGFL